MHRHGYRGTKFHRERGQRQALLKSLAESLILDESIETTLPKAKAVASYTEKLVGKAKKGKESLHNRRMVIAGLATLEAAHKLVDEIVPRLKDRNSGYFRIERTTLRRGDGAQLAKISFVDEAKAAKQSDKKGSQKPIEESEAKEAEKTTPAPVVNENAGKLNQPQTPSVAPKRSGIRGNR